MNADISRGARPPRSHPTARHLFASLLVAIGLVFLPSFAEGQDAPPPPAEAGADKGDVRKRVGKKLRDARREFLQKRIGLDEAGVDRLETILDRHVKETRKARRALKKAHRALVQAVETDIGDEAELSRLERELQSSMENVAKVKTSVFDETREFLTPKQQARLMVALPKFEKRVEKLLKRAKRKKAGKKGKRGKRGRRDRLDRPNPKPHPLDETRRDRKGPGGKKKGPKNQRRLQHR